MIARFFAAFVAACVCFASPAYAQAIGSPYDVPPISAASNAAVPPPTAAPVAAPSVPQGLGRTVAPQAGTGPSAGEQIAANAMSGALTAVANLVNGAMNSSTSIGIKIYVALTIISFSWAAIFWMMDGSNLSFIVKNVLSRMIETSLWIAVIANTWGGFGWFKAVLEAGANIGVTLAGFGNGSASFTNGELTSNVAAGGNGVFNWDGNINTLPGSMVGFGAALFNAIVASAQFGDGGMLSLFQDAINGHMLVSLVTYVLAIGSGIWAFCVMAYCAVRLWLSLMNVYMIAPMSFLQGLAGSRRLSGYAGSFISGSLVMGIEICLTVMMCGLMYKSIVAETQYFGSINTWLIVGSSKQTMHAQGNPLQGACGLPLVGMLPICGEARSAVDIGTLVAVDTTLALYLWMLLNVPSRAKALLEGRFSLSPQEVAQALNAAPVPGAKVAGYGMNVMNAGASGGFEGAFKTATAPLVNAGKELAKLGAIAAIGVATDGVGLAAVGSAGATGLELGGLSGAGAGMLGKAIGSGMFSKAAAGAGESAAADAAGAEAADASEAAQAADAAESPATQNASSTQGSESPNVQRPAPTVDGPGSSTASADVAPDTGDQSQTSTVHRNTVYEDAGGTAPSGDVDAAEDGTASRTIEVETELHQILRNLPNSIAAAVAAATGGDGGGSGGSSGGSGGSSGAGGGQSSLQQLLGNFSEEKSLGRSLLKKIADLDIERGPEPSMPIDEQGYASFGPGPIRVGGE